MRNLLAVSRKIALIASIATLFSLTAYSQLSLRKALDFDGDGMADGLEAEARDERVGAVLDLIDLFGYARDRGDLVSAEAAVQELQSWGDPDALLPGWRQRLDDLRRSEAVGAARQCIHAGDWAKASALIATAESVGVGSEQIRELRGELAEARRSAATPTEAPSVITPAAPPSSA